MNKKPDKKPIDFFMPKNKARAGTGGTCVCPECGHEMPHDAGSPCNEVSCPKCGAEMTRGKTADKPQGNTFVDRHPDPDWMHSLPGYQDELAIHEELAQKYAKDKSEDEGEV